jgi:hypothetical protein
LVFQLKPGSETSSCFICADAATALPSHAKQLAAGQSNPTRGARFQNEVVNLSLHEARVLSANRMPLHDIQSFIGMCSVCGRIVSATVRAKSLSRDQIVVRYTGKSTGDHETRKSRECSLWSFTGHEATRGHTSTVLVSS